MLVFALDLLFGCLCVRDRSRDCLVDFADFVWIVMIFMF